MLLSGAKKITPIFHLFSSLKIIVLTILIVGCKTNETGFALDETETAAKIVAEANEDLKLIRKLYKENEGKVEQIKQAIKDNKIEDVRRIADDLVYIINDGMALGESAIEKISKAEKMNINQAYKQYLELKRASLEKQIEAFEFRRQAAVLLRDSFGTKDKFIIEKAKSDFKDKEENFRKHMEIARQLSAEANQLAKEAMREQ
ncbi:MAG: hypothetical protein N2Z23_04340 [Pyrinomonadaceae bacterium]|nr:hypothetical protein [Pyrinomonadaceae bacterium]MCX7639653.1 hypothetical protein [Pyrinomonadaceae bacterium]MDW8303329.1 hypothetical protein [Acidobacteriota bacterium]